MATFLLTWNPRKWPWTDLEKDIDELQASNTLFGSWSCGKTKRLLAGDRIFLLRQGVEPRGLVASGWVVTEAYSEIHWADEGPAGRETMYVEIQWDTLRLKPIITREELDHEPFLGVNWNTQTSGIKISPEVARSLEQEWGKRTGSHFEPAPEEILDADSLELGHHIVPLNAYERLGTPRALCIARYGLTCHICGFDFGKVYGEAGSGLIHIHHLVNGESIDKRYKLDPIADLRPVCPNCHSMLHRREPPYTLEEVAAFLHPGGAPVSLTSPTTPEEVLPPVPETRQGILRDPVEDLNEYLRVETTAGQAARTALIRSGIDPDAFGSCHDFWREKKRILKEEFGIEWRTPHEMNPGIVFD